jgi:hypothetical protein
MKKLTLALTLGSPVGCGAGQGHPNRRKKTNHALGRIVSFAGKHGQCGRMKDLTSRARPPPGHWAGGHVVSLGDAGLVQPASVLPWPPSTCWAASRASLTRTRSLSPHCSSAFANCARMFFQSGSGFRAVIYLTYQSPGSGHSSMCPAWP